jgi:hypothetical protein
LKPLSLQKGLRGGNVESSISPYTKQSVCSEAHEFELRVALRIVDHRHSFYHDDVVEQGRSEPLDANRSWTDYRARTKPQTGSYAIPSGVAQCSRVRARLHWHAGGRFLASVLPLFARWVSATLWCEIFNAISQASDVGSTVNPSMPCGWRARTDSSYFL